MFGRLRTTSLAGSGALVLVLAVSGVVAAASMLTAIAAPVSDPVEPAVDTTLTFEDLNANGVDDDCEADVIPADEAAAVADAAVDLDGDGTISVSEAALSDRTGGVNCNHGGYVSNVAHGSCDAALEEGEATEGDTTDEDVVEPDADLEDGDTPDADDAATGDADCDATEEEEPAETTAEDPPSCEAAEGDETTPADEPVTETDVEEPKNHGEVVSKVARSDAVGGKNCNHGGAVSEASHEDNDARKAEREAAKAERQAEREAAKAERQAEREAAKGSKGKGHNR